MAQYTDQVKITCPASEPENGRPARFYLDPIAVGKSIELLEEFKLDQDCHARVVVCIMAPKDSRIARSGGCDNLALVAVHVFQYEEVMFGRQTIGMPYLFVLLASVSRQHRLGVPGGT